MTFDRFFFKNFTPSFEEAGLANLVLSRLLERAPVNSNCSANLEKDNLGFAVHIEVVTQAGILVASEHGPTVKDTLAKAESTMLNHYRDWHLKRDLTGALGGGVWEEDQPASGSVFLK